MDKRRAAAHLDLCAPTHDADTGKIDTLLRFKIGQTGAPEYWLFVEARAGATLSGLDTFLRHIWLECCGHLSMFSVPPYRYASVRSEFAGFMGRADTERSMSGKIAGAFSAIGVKGTYDYDFGSTTRLTIELTSARNGRIGRSAVRLLLRNDPPAWTCGACDQPATLVCCAHETETSPLVCAAHQKSHPCRDRAFLPVVNSPRMGVCAYAG